jgi:D-alanyl-lipoteichoic acid acyltransferase DltB (MBOAT superfamily)
MTLSNFVTTYIYTPIIRSFETFSYRNSLVAIFVAMLICGFWHGAGWTFIFWGALQGGALVVNHLWRKRRLGMPRWLGWFITFNFFNMSLVFFRAKEWHTAIKVLQGMIGVNGFVPPTLFETVGGRGAFSSKFGQTLLEGIGGSNRTLWGLLVVTIFVLVLKNSNELKDRFQPTWKTCAFMVILSFYTFLNMGKVSEFLYFQF